MPMSAEGAVLFMFAPIALVVAGQMGVQTRLQALFSSSESQAGSSPQFSLEAFLFAWTREHRRIRDRRLTRSVMLARVGYLMTPLMAVLILKFML